MGGQITKFYNIGILPKMAGIDPSKIRRDTRFIYEKLVERQRTGFQDPVIFAKIDFFISEGQKSL